MSKSDMDRAIDHLVGLHPGYRYEHWVGVWRGLPGGNRLDLNELFWLAPGQPEYVIVHTAPDVTGGAAGPAYLVACIRHETKTIRGWWVWLKTSPAPPGITLRKMDDLTCGQVFDQIFLTNRGQNAPH